MKQVVSEKIAIATAKDAAREMFSATTESCALGLELAKQASIKYGRASARLGDTHPVLRESYREMAKDFDRLVARCTRR